MMLREFPRRDDLAPTIAARSRASYCKGESENVDVPALFNVCRRCSFRPGRSGIGFRRGGRSRFAACPLSRLSWGKRKIGVAGRAIARSSEWPYTLIQLYLFREKQRASEIMNDAAKGLSDDDLRNVADFVGKLPAPLPVEGGDAVRLERGRALLGLYHCNACHRADLSGQQSVPRIAAQREDYLVKTLSEYKSRVRIGYDATMAEALQPVSADEIADLVYFIARQP